MMKNLHISMFSALQLPDQTQTSPSRYTFQSEQYDRKYLSEKANGDETGTNHWERSLVATRLMLATLLFLLLPTLGEAQTKAPTLDAYMKKQGLVDVTAADTTLRVHLYYATTDNFMKHAVCKGLTRAWLHPKAAAMLLKASRLLRTEHPHWHLLIYDAARPMSVQKTMWALVRGTDNTNYVSNPAHGGGLHNYGMAVDLTLMNEHERPVPMGTSFDFFGPKAHINNEAFLLSSKQITKEEYNNRQLLRRIMRQAGFRTILYEWWHFNACSRSEARAKFAVIP